LKTQFKYQLINILTIILGFVIIYSCNTAPKPKTNDVKYTYYYDLDSILKAKRLSVLMEYSSTGYFIYKGLPMGFEYEILNNYCKHLNVSMHVVPIDKFESVFDDLNEGKGDLIAANLTITKERTKKAAFTIPYTYTRQVLVQRKSTSNDSVPFIRSPLELAHKHIVTHKNTSFFERLIHLSEEIGAPIYIDSASSAITSEELIDKVASGEINYTVADENIARVMQHFFPNIDISIPLSMKQKISFALRKQKNISIC
jgi:membrane-bound lytic murein transglycosylase F